MANGSTSYDPAIRGAAWQTALGLYDLATPGSLKANPTLAGGDVQVDKDGAGFNPITTLPTVTPAAGRRVSLALSADEMNAYIVTVQFVDQTSPKEWSDVLVVIPTRVATPAVAGDLMGLVDGAIAEAKVTTPAETAGRPSGLLAMMRRVFEWHSNKRTRDRSNGLVKLMNDGASDQLEEQIQHTASSTDSQTQGQ